MGPVIAVDAMGGDHAPRVVLRGVALAMVRDPSMRVALVGDERQIHNELQQIPDRVDSARVRIVHASQVVGMEEAPLEALRNKKDSSILRVVELVARGEAAAVVSAGNTGACAAASQLLLRPLACVSRPGIAVIIPSFHGPFVLCDVGANIQAKPKHLHEYAIMAGLYAETVLARTNPRVALMSVGEEDGKGTGLVKKAHELLRADNRIHYVGSAEGRELFENKCDVAVCDGFVGNVVLKLAEGLAEGIFRTIAAEFQREPADSRERVVSALDRVRLRHDYSEYGGAPLLGINGVCIICHGRSNENAICNALLTARRFLDAKFNVTLAERMN